VDGNLPRGAKARVARVHDRDPATIGRIWLQFVDSVALGVVGDKDDRSYLVLEGEQPPPRARKSKRLILKTMFLAAVASPRYVLPQTISIFTCLPLIFYVYG
jgi:hypothetical protein